MIIINYLFNGLTKSEIDEVNSMLPQKSSFKKGDELYKNGLLGIITSGKAAISRIALTGQPLMIRMLSEGEIFGSASIFGDWKEGASSIIAESDGQIIYIDEKTFKEILKKSEKVTFNYITFLTERIRFLNRRIDAFSAGSTEQKLYEFLLSQKDESGDYHLNVSLVRLSEMLNVGRTSLYRDLSALESKGLIKRENKKIHIF